MVNAFEATGKTKEGGKQEFFCGSGADVCLVNESKTNHDKMKVDTKRGKSMRVTDVTGDKVNLVGTPYY